MAHTKFDINTLLMSFLADETTTVTTAKEDVEQRQRIKFIVQQKEHSHTIYSKHVPETSWCDRLSYKKTQKLSTKEMLKSHTRKCMKKAKGKT